MSDITKATRNELVLNNGIDITSSIFGGRLMNYLEFLDRIVVRVAHNRELIEPDYNIYRNIFCYSKKDGSLLWQVQQPYDRRDGEPLEEIFKNIKLYTEKDNGQVQRYSDPEEYPWDSEIIGNSYTLPFRKGVDKLKTMTLGQFPNEYWINYETGELEWIAIHQKI